jgi:hypothetical protein
MDKNRPLPPGTAFDQFRQKDFERRKAEGFPPPLYKSTVPTPEVTPEQQTERVSFGKKKNILFLNLFYQSGMPFLIADENLELNLHP